MLALRRAPRAWPGALSLSVICAFSLLVPTLATAASRAPARAIRPAVLTQPASGITPTTARLKAVVNPRGRTTRYWFQYGRGRRYGRSTAARLTRPRRRRVLISEPVTGLAPLTTYHYRIVATNCRRCRRGTSRGRDLTLTVGGYENPAYPSADVADPYVLDNGGLHRDYWAFATGDLFPILHSTDLVHWASAGSAMSSRPAWVIRSGDWHPWAPSVVRAPESCPGTSSSSCYVMYYVGLSAQSGANCVAVATATAPGGPYTDLGPLTNGTSDASDRPVGCGDDSGYGEIDPSWFVDPRDGRLYLYISEDFACAPGSTACTAANSRLAPTISVIPMSRDFIHPSGPRVPLLSGAAGTWESSGLSVPTVEGPTVIAHEGLYYLMYSGGSWRSAYGMGYAVAMSPTGPFMKYPSNPILAQRASVMSTGGGDTPVVGPRGGTWIVYHGRSGSYAAGRTLRIDPFLWRPLPDAPDAPMIWGPTYTPQPFQP